MNIFEEDKQYIANTYKRFPVAIVRGQGAVAYDEGGKRYIDLGAGIAVNTFGYSDTEWVRAVTDQLATLQHTSNLYYTKPQVELAKMLCARTGMAKVFFSNSGAEANECAIKTARKYASDRYGEERKVIVTLKNSFHGRTITTLSATGQEVFHRHFGPFTPGFVHAEPNDLDEMRRLLEAHPCCAVMMEPVQGEGGVCVLDPGYVREVARMAKEKDILLIFDEVQTGNGRTGALFAYQHYGITPDLVTTAKGLAGGLPFGATLFSEKVASVLSLGDHGSTFGGNPVCAAGALSILSRIDDTLLADVRRKGDCLRAELTDMPKVRSISGMGLMLGVEVIDDAADLVARGLERGLIMLTAKAKLRLLPPLNITDDELKEAAAILKDLLS